MNPTRRRAVAANLVVALSAFASSACVMEVDTSGESAELTQGIGTPVIPPTGGVSVPPPTIVVVHNAAELQNALSAASTAQARTIVDIPENVAIDLTNINCGVRPSSAPDTADCTPLYIPAGVTLRGTRGGLRSGALLFTTRMRVHRVFEIAGDFVQIEGLRFRGPSPGTEEALPPVNGIFIPAALHATVVNNELFNFPGSAIQVQGQDDFAACQPHMPGRPHLQRISNNYIHHNQRKGLGYGVVVGDGAFPLIEKNTFDSNRHSIAADGQRTTGYRAMDNLVLSGGGEYCGTWGCWYEHAFDMHGTENAPHYDSGDAGDFVEIAYNTFRGAQEYGPPVFGKTRAAYFVRGTPCDRNTFHHNVLLHDDIDDALLSNSEIDDRVLYSANQLDVDTSNELLVGDFDGDGRDDLFMATGAAWYYSSGGKTEWRFLVRRPERASSLRIGNFDLDARADVFNKVGDQWRYSSAGTGAWTNLAGGSIPLAELRFGDFDGNGITDVFRATGTEWLVSYGGASVWTRLSLSGMRVNELGFGNFDANSTTDVFSLANNRWSVSYGGVTKWIPLRNMQSLAMNAAVFADFDGNGITDVLMSQVVPFGAITWYMSADGVGAWAEIFQTPSNDPLAVLSQHWIGNFDGNVGADALRYAPATSAFDSVANRLVRWSTATNSYVSHSREGMR